MAYNHGREDRKWRIWKEAEEKLLRECGVDEATIEQIRMADRADFNSNRRFYRWTNDVAEYLEDMAGRERQAQVVRICDRRHIQWCDRCRILSVDGEPCVVPFRLPHGRDTRNATTVLLTFPDHHKWRPVYQLRKLQHALRNGHRCAQLRTTRREYRSFQLRGLCL